MELWYLLSIISVLTMSSFYYLTKKLLTSKFDPILFAGMMQVTVGIIALTISLIFGFKFTLNLQSIKLLALGTIAYNIGPILYYSGLAKVELSKSIILESSGVFWGLLMGFLILGEGFTFSKIIASLMIFIAVIVISFKKTTFKLSSYDLIILASSIFYAFAATMDKSLVQFSNPISYIAVSFLCGGSTLLLTNYKRFNYKRWQIIKAGIKKLIINASFVVISYVFVFSAYSLGGEASRVYAITQTQTIMVALIGIILLKEKDNLWRKVIAICLAFGGLLLMS